MGIPNRQENHRSKRDHDRRFRCYIVTTQNDDASNRNGRDSISHSNASLIAFFCLFFSFFVIVARGVVSGGFSI